MWNLIIGSTHKDHLCVETCLKQNFIQRPQCEGHLRPVCLDSSWFLSDLMLKLHLPCYQKDHGMKLEYLCDGSLDSHGMNPGDRGIPSVLQAGSCKSGRIFHKSPGELTLGQFYSSAWWNHSEDKSKESEGV